MNHRYMFYFPVTVQGEANRHFWWLLVSALENCSKWPTAKYLGQRKTHLVALQARNQSWPGCLIS